MRAAGDYKLAAMDMDGTLLNTAHEITPYTREVLKRAAEAGKTLALSTGRCLSELREHLRTIPGIAYVIGENGACVYEVGSARMIHQVAMDDGDVDYVFETVRPFDALPQCFIDNQSYIQCGPDEQLLAYHIHDFAGVFRAGSVFVDDLRACCAAKPGRVEKINLYFARPEERDRFRALMAGRRVALSDSIGIGVEMSPMEATKARGLRALCDWLNLPVEQTVAVGDGGNDLDIMRAAGFSVAMANAIEPVRALADALTVDCDHDGAAKAIEKYLLGE